MSELSYKELQEQGVFDVPYRAFKYMQSQQAKIDELQAKVDKAMKYIEPSDELSHKAYRDLVKILKGNKDAK